MNSDHSKQKQVIKAASACVWRGNDVLLIQRASALGRGRWSLPGGKLELGESVIAAAHRELFEETSVIADLVLHVIDSKIETADVVYDISCFTGHYVRGDAIAGSDAGAVVWCHWQQIGQFNLAPNIQTAVTLAHKLISV
jgi:8-oxo-dGTP diphosphatase